MRIVTTVDDPLTLPHTVCKLSVSMTLQHVELVLESDGFVSSSQKLVLIELAFRADKKGIIRQTQSEIATSSGLSRTTVAEWFAAFEKVSIIDRKGHGRYQFLPDAFEPTEDWNIGTLLAKASRAKAEHH